MHEGTASAGVVLGFLVTMVRRRSCAERRRRGGRSETLRREGRCAFAQRVARASGWPDSRGRALEQFQRTAR